ncbi:MAG: O-antigen ligase family protein, partial [Nitrosospira sp.]|nr:O-antigen ligase family protein [Nitrosospira sp.]
RAPGYVSTVTFVCLMAFTFVLILSPQEHFTALKPLHLAQLFAMLAGGFYLRDRFRYGAPPPAGLSEYTWVALLVLWAIVTVPLSIWPGGSVNTITELFLKAVITFWLLGRVVNTPERLKMAAWILALCSVFLSFSAVKTFFSGGFANYMASAGPDRISGYESGLAANPNGLALVLVLILPLTLALVPLAKRFALKVLLVAFAVLDVVAIFATYSRGGFLALVTALVVYAIVLWRRGNRTAVMLLVLLGVAAVPMLPDSYTNRLDTIVAYQEDQSGSAEARLEGMTLAAGYTLRNPVIGTGIGMDMLALNELRDTNKWHHVHDVYLRYSMELGLPGLALFLLLFYSVLKGCNRARRFSAARKTPQQRNLFFLSEGLLVSLITFGVAAVFYPAAYQFYFFYFAGLAAAAKTIAQRLETNEAETHQCDTSEVSTMA